MEPEHTHTYWKEKHAICEAFNFVVGVLSDVPVIHFHKNMAEIVRLLKQSLWIGSGSACASATINGIYFSYRRHTFHEYIEEPNALIDFEETRVSDDTNTIYYLNLIDYDFHQKHLHTSKTETRCFAEIPETAEELIATAMLVL